jgi:hypothetical protein
MVGPKILEIEKYKAWIAEKEQIFSKVFSFLYHNAWHIKVLMPKLIAVAQKLIILIR